MRLLLAENHCAGLLRTLYTEVVLAQKGSLASILHLCEVGAQVELQGLAMAAKEQALGQFGGVALLGLGSSRKSCPSATTLGW